MIRGELCRTADAQSASLKLSGGLRAALVAAVDGGRVYEGGHLVDLLAPPQVAVDAGGGGASDEFHADGVEFGVEGVVGGDFNGQARRMLQEDDNAFRYFSVSLESA